MNNFKTSNTPPLTIGLIQAQEQQNRDKALCETRDLLIQMNKDAAADRKISKRNLILTAIAAITGVLSLILTLVQILKS